MPINPELVKAIRRDFEGTKCRNCGKPKEKAQSFCKPCYLDLPKQIQNDLWKPFGSGYEEAVLTARRWQKDEMIRDRQGKLF
jgi:hypothetical protein